MSDFRKLTDDFYASPQLTPDDVAKAAEAGVSLIVNNRPDGESPSEPQGAQIEAAARAAGMDYLAIPIDHSGFGMAQVDALADTIARQSGTVLGYCRSGTRSTFLWALARAKAGVEPDTLAASAANAGYDISPVRPTLEMLAGQAKD